jgi:hypothetical protein
MPDGLTTHDSNSRFSRNAICDRIFTGYNPSFVTGNTSTAVKLGQPGTNEIKIRTEIFYFFKSIQITSVSL